MKKYDPENEKMDELENLLDRVTFICDSGYFTDSNIEACIIEGVELIVMSKQVARQENNKKREKWYREIGDVKNHESDKVTKYLCIRVEEGYLCPFNRLIKKVRVRFLFCEANYIFVSLICGFASIVNLPI